MKTMKNGMYVLLGLMFMATTVNCSNKKGAEKAAELGAVDAVIAAGETRQAIVSALDLTEGKRVTNLPKKHSNIPF